MKVLFIAALLAAFLPAKDNLIGKWQSKPSEKGNVTGVNFKADNTLEGYVNKKPFVSGRYSFNPQDSTLFFVDNGCNGASAVYKVLFFNNSDSLRFQVVSDKCEERQKGMLRLIMGKIK